MNQSPRYNPSQHANVCLLLEGTYPYIRGGVSTWVRQLIEGMPELTFSIIFLGGQEDDYREPVYELPDNLVHLENHMLLDTNADAPAPKQRFWQRKPDRSDLFEQNLELHGKLADAESVPDDQTASAFAKLLIDENGLTRADLEHGDDAWLAIREKYNDAPAGLDFNHFFWTVRTMHSPLFTLAQIAKSPPSADLYHSVSTGYAGYLGVLLKASRARPYVISEHGIYTKERELDLAQVDWIPQDADPFRVGLDDSMGYLRQVWIRFFKSLGRMAYDSSDHVYTLYNGNRLRQIDDGANPQRLTIVPNGVNVEHYSKVRRDDDAPVPQVLALIGRVVPIKDIKTFIRAMRIVRSKLPDAEGWLIGPEDEDEAYSAECRALVESLDLQDCIQFKGFRKIDEIFPQVGLSVLTSVSEGQPLVVLEGYAAGIPAVTTDVGSCSELIYGVTPEDQALGSAGAVVPIANPAAFAEASINLLTDNTAWQQARDAAIERVETYYDEVQMIASYRKVYTDRISTTADLAKPQGQ